MMTEKYVIAVDVGTLTARASVIDLKGTFLSTATHKLSIRRQGELVYEQSTEDIWRAVRHAVKSAVAESLVNVEQVVGIGFDATCSLVLWDTADKPIAISSGASLQAGETMEGALDGTVYDVMMWCDHRAVQQVEQIIATGHETLRFWGERISVEANPAKLRWLVDTYGDAFLRDRVGYIADLTDFLTLRATGSRARSLNTAAAKFMFQKSNGGFAAPFYRAIGLHALADDGFAKLDAANIRAPGSFIGQLTELAAAELGLPQSVRVGAGLVDAYAGYVGSIAMSDSEEASLNSASLKSRIALICGTSICALSEYDGAQFVGGVWGPFERAVFDESSSWFLSGGQSSAGSVLDYLVRNHAAHDEFERRGGFESLVQHIETLASRHSNRVYDTLTKDLHVYPDFHGNRSPLADPTMCGMITGLTLTDDYDSLSRLYLAAMQSICYQTRYIFEKLGQSFSVICMSGGLSRNRVFVQQLANITGVNVLTPDDRKEPVLLGSAMIAATAAGIFPSLREACLSMNARGSLTKPNPSTNQFHEAKYRVFLKMLENQLQYRSIMESAL